MSNICTQLPEKRFTLVNHRPSNGQFQRRPGANSRNQRAQEKELDKNREQWKLRCLHTRHGELKTLSGMQQMQRPNKWAALCRARRRCSRRLEGHSDHCAWSKISMMMRSWSCAYSRMSWMRLRPQQYSIRRSLHRVRRGWDSVKVSQWIWRLQEPTERCGTSVLKMTGRNSDECRIENSLNFLREVRHVMSFLLCWTRVQKREKSADWKQRKLSHRSKLVYRATNCKWKCENTSFMDIPKFPVLGRCLRFNPSSMTQECIASMVRCAAGVWELKDWKTKQSSWESERDGSQVPKKLLKYFVEMVDGNVTRDLFTWQENQKQYLSILHNLW